MYIIMLKKFKVIKRNIQDLVFSDRWNMYKDDMGHTQFVKEKVLDDLLWEKINYIIAFIESNYDMIRVMMSTDHLFIWCMTCETQQSRRLKVIFIDTKEKEKMNNRLFMMLCIKSWRIDGTRVTCHFNVWHTLWI